MSPTSPRSFWRARHPRLVLDIDNTLTADRSQELPDEVAGWLAQMKEAGIGLTIVSNGAEKRVRPFAEKLGLAYLYRSAKPLPSR